MDDLDRRIRELMARAVADAPEAPTLDEPAQRNVDRPRSSTRWIAGSVAGFSVAAAVVALFWVAANQVADETVTPLETTPPVTISPTSTDVPVPTDPVTTDPVTTQPEAAPPSTAAPTTTLVPTTSSPTPAPAGEAIGEFVNAGPEGVWAYQIGGGGGSGGTITDEPMAVAFLVPDGRVFMQRSADARDAAADTTILIWEPGFNQVIEQPMPTEELAAAPKRLHDVAQVDGEVVLLIEVGPEICNGFPACDGSLVALHADSGQVDVLLEQSMWESGYGQLHLASTGVIVGAAFSEATSYPFSAVLPGVDADPIDFEQFDLEASYVDGGCSTSCPSAYSIDRSGTTVAWLEWSPDAYVVAIAAAGGTGVERFPLVDERTDSPGDGFSPSEWLEVADASGRVLYVNSRTAIGMDPVAPFVIDLGLDRGTLGTTGLAPGTVVTAG